MKALCLAALALVAFTAVGCAQKASPEESAEVATGEVNATAAIDLENWLTHPKIVAVRDVVNEIDAASESDLKTESKDAALLCEAAGHGEMERTKLTDPSGVIRELVIGYGSEDSAQTESHQHAEVWKESASKARLSSSPAARRLARASQAITSIESAVRTMPIMLASGWSRVQSARPASIAT